MSDGTTIERVRELEDQADGEYANQEGLVGAIIRDADVVAGSPCQGCGGEREYVPVVHDGRYRAFGICETCNNVIEM